MDGTLQWGLINLQKESALNVNSFLKANILSYKASNEGALCTNDYHINIEASLNTFTLVFAPVSLQSLSLCCLFKTLMALVKHMHV